ncbi:MAG: DNA-binding response regulator [Winogradskyella sp.]|uniref:response regulator transcription factor n=1 Tax=Winogradskyella sp. TaxID=1883156 RepID=UPI000F40F7C1|nr:response regulator transcription factor [Winogradskyella sp.]RNC88399.1 MAG: DNA-binding response regulator [Winogradskyella sp.]
MSQKIKIAIADDELLFRQGLMAILQNEEDIHVVFDAENGEDLLTKLKSLRQKPDIIITDLKMPVLNGVEATKILSERFPDIKIIALTSYYSKPFILNMISIGAVAYLAKNSTPSLMTKTIREVYNKGFYYNGKVFQYIQENKKSRSNKTVKSALDADFISSRELEILELICKQYTAKQIADSIGISARTVEVHRRSLMLKTETRNIAGLVIYAIKNNIVNIENETSFD